ncbi:DUF6680 family protein [Legionella sp. WA2022007384]
MNKQNIKLLFFSFILLMVLVLLHYYWVMMEWKDIIMTAAVIIGPIVAVIIARTLDDEKFSKERKLEIFRALVKDRSNPLSYDFVNAFNLIQIEFSKDKQVIDAWKSLYNSRQEAGPAKDDHEGWGRKIAEWNSKTDRLLFEIATILDMKVNPFDIQASYIPVAWGNEQQLNSEIRALLLKLLKNEISLQIKNSESVNTMENLSDELRNQ